MGSSGPELGRRGGRITIRTRCVRTGLHAQTAFTQQQHTAPSAPTSPSATSRRNPGAAPRRTLRARRRRAPARAAPPRAIVGPGPAASSSDTRSRGAQRLVKPPQPRARGPVRPDAIVGRVPRQGGPYLSAALQSPRAKAPRPASSARPPSQNRRARHPSAPAVSNGRRRGVPVSASQWYARRVDAQAPPDCGLERLVISVARFCGEQHRHEPLVAAETPASVPPCRVLQARGGAPAAASPCEAARSRGRSRVQRWFAGSAAMASPNAWYASAYAQHEVLSRNIRQLSRLNANSSSVSSPGRRFGEAGSTHRVRRAFPINLELDEGHDRAGGIAQLLDEHDDVVHVIVQPAPGCRPPCRSSSVSAPCHAKTRRWSWPLRGGHDVSWLPDDL